MVMQVIDSPDFAKRDTSSVQSISYGGAPCPPDLVRRIKEHFPTGAPGNGYGLTETSAMTTMNTGDDYVRKPDSVGPPSPVCDVAVVPEDWDGRRAPGRPGTRPRPHRRAVDQGPQRGPRLLEPARGHRRLVHQRLAPHRRRGPHRRGGLRPHRRPGQGHDHPGRRERLLRRDRGAPSTSTRPWPTARSSACPTRCWARRSGRSSCSARAWTWPPTSCPATSASAWPPSTCPTRYWFRAEALPRNPAGKILKRELRTELLGDAPVF